MIMHTPKTRGFSIPIFALASALIFGSSYYMGIHLQAFTERTRQVQQSLDTNNQFDETLSLVTDAETGSRGYIIMGQELFLHPYYAAMASSDGIVPHLKELRRLTLNNPRQQQLLDRLEPLVGEKLAFMKKVIEVRRHAGFEAAKELIATDSGRQMMVQVRRALLEMHNIEAVLLKQRYDEASAQLQATILAMIIGFGSGIFLLLFSFVTVNREVGVRKRAEEALLQLNSELVIANKELLYQNEEKEKRAAELVLANKELLFQNEEKEKRAAELIIAMHDYLTGLPNRRLLSERLSLTLAQCRRNKAMAALLIFDLDNFKIVNDSLGHAVGDTLLQEVAARSAATLKRSTDSISRLGGDEFVILLPQIVAVSDAVAIAEKIRNNIKEPYNIEGHTINISCSIGIAVYPDHGEDEITLMKHADDAMYSAKNQGRGKVMVFETEAIHN